MTNTPNNLAPKTHRFSFHSANAMLPLVRSIAKDVYELLKTIGDTKERLSAINTAKPASSRASKTDDLKNATPYTKEVEAIVVSVDRMEERLDDCVNELVDLNLVAPEVDRPFVDFPAIYDDSDVLLCWKIGEDKIMHWHLPGESCSQRRPVDLDRVPTKVELTSTL